MFTAEDRHPIVEIVTPLLEDTATRALQQAGDATQTTTWRPGTVQSVDTTTLTVVVLVDGDLAPITVSAIGVLPLVGGRAMVLFVPPSAVFCFAMVVTSGLNLSGFAPGSGSAQLVLGPVLGDVNAGGSITWKGASIVGGTTYLDWRQDVYQSTMRFMYNNVVVAQFDSTYFNAVTGVIAPNFYLAADFINYFSYRSNQAGMPYMDGVILASKNGWAFYSSDTGTYRMGFRANAANTVRYLWNNDYTLLGMAPSDGNATHTLRVEGTTYFNGTVQGASTAVFAGQIQTAHVGSSSYSDASIWLNPGTSTVSLSWHPGGVAPQLRVGNGVATMYVRQYDDAAYNTLTGILTNVSSRREKQDIAAWPPAPVPGYMASGVEGPVVRALDKVMAMQPSHFRWKRDAHLAQLRNDGPDVPPEEHISTVHECGIDCKGSPAEPCPRVQNWEKGHLGLIAEDVHAVLPEAIVLGPDGLPESVYEPALIALCIAAIQELKTEVENLRGSKPAAAA